MTNPLDRAESEMEGVMSEASMAEIQTAVKEVTEKERATYAPGTTEPIPVPKENGLPVDFPVHIMTGTAGYFAAIMGECMEPPRHFFFMAYLACLGTILSNRITLKTELRPQPRLYLVILGESADDRKSTAITKTVGFFQNAVADFFVCFGVGSAEGLQRRFKKDASFLLVYDELKAFVGKAKSEGSILLPCVCTLFESNRYESYTKTKEIILSDACLSILAASTIETYSRCWDSAFQDIGMTNRLFVVPGQGQRRFAIPGKIPTHEWELMKVNLGSILSVASCTPELDITAPARALFEKWYMNLEQSVHTKRLDTYALRFMILLTVNAGKSEVDEAIVRDVIDLMNWQLQARRLHDPVDADSAIAKVEEKIRRVLSAGPRSERDLSRAVHGNRIGIWTFKGAIKNLTQNSEISYDKKTKTWGPK